MPAAKPTSTSGCLQVNVGHHPDAFVSLEEAFDPLANAAYAAAYLRALFMETGSWPEAVGRYHSATPIRNTRYRTKVLDFWNQARSPGWPAAAMDAEKPRGPTVRRGERPHPPATPSLDADALGELKSRLGGLAPH